MDFELSDEQRLFREVLRDFVDREIRPVAQEWEASGRYPAEIVATMREMGLFGLTVPEQYGGLGADMISFALVFEEIAKGWMGIAGILGTHSLSCWLIAQHGTEEQKRRYLPDLASGKRRTGIALTEPDAGTDLQGIRTVARRVGDNYVVNGTKTWISNAIQGHVCALLVKTDPDAQPRHKGISMLITPKIDPDTRAPLPGVKNGKKLEKLGYKGIDSGEFIFEDYECSAELSLVGGEEGKGFLMATGGLEIGRINVAARSVGIARRALAESVKYAQMRKTMGKPICEHQAIQLKLGEMAAKTRAAELLVSDAARAFDAGGRIDMEAGMAKYFASETALEVATEAMRIHGAYGYSKEYPIERLYRDAPLMCIGEGTNEMQRIIIAKQLVARNPI
jgi:alkylation response protein AidB-like acyl-CoA dehydrogenase